MQRFIKNPKITSVTGLIGSLAMLISSILSYSVYGNVSFQPFMLLDNVFKIGLVLYFGNIITRLFFNTGSLKFSNYILIITLTIFIIASVLGRSIIQALVFVCVLLYFLNILFNKNTHINNKIFALLLGGYSIISTIMFFMSMNNIPNAWH